MTKDTEFDDEYMSDLAEEPSDNRVYMMGRYLGTSNGWDQIDTFHFCFYDFEPVVGLNVPPGHTTGINFEAGCFEQWDESGKVIFRADLISSLANIPQKDYASTIPTTKE